MSNTEAHIFDLLRVPSRFNRLREVLDGVTVKDIRDIKKEEFVAFFPQTVLAFVLWKHIQGELENQIVLQKQQAYLNSCTVNADDSYEIAVKYQKLTLKKAQLDGTPFEPNVSEKGVLTFAGLVNYFNHNSKQTCIDIYDVLPALERIKSNLKFVKFLDLSHNTFMDSDVLFIDKIVAYVASHTEQEFVVDLSYSNISGYIVNTKAVVDKCIMELLRNEKVKYLIVIRTPFASIDRKDFYTDNCDNIILQKLIWIGWQFLAGHYWKSLLNEREDELDAIMKFRETHFTFYSDFPRFQSC